ncbi:MAG: N-acetylmuramoyl-L-alanine amidase, partial [Pseudomonadota bacterium]
SLQRKLFTLDNPSRIVIDLPQAKLAPGLRLPGGTGPVSRLRSGAQPKQTVRFVLELTGPQPSRSRFTGNAQNGYQLVVDIGQETAASPAAVPTVALRPAHAPANTGRDIIVAIDAGHGGQDPGAIGRGGTREKDVVLGIARALARRLDAEPGMRAALTRDSDRFVVLRDRMNRARAARADIFVSIHADSIANRSISGSSVYVLSERGASNEAARWLAEQENAADLKGGVSLGDKSGQLASVLMDLSQTASIGSSVEVAEQVLGALDRVGNVRKSQVQQAPFLVLKSPDIPSLLVETAYISNPEEEKRLRTGSHQEAIANSIFTGVREYFRASPPDGTQFAATRAQRDRNRGGGAPIIAGNTVP